MIYGLDMIALKERLEVAQLKMVKFSVGVPRMVKIRHGYNTGTGQFGNIVERMLNMELEGRKRSLERKDLFKLL